MAVSVASVCEIVMRRDSLSACGASLRTTLPAIGAIEQHRNIYKLHPKLQSCPLL